MIPEMQIVLLGILQLCSYVMAMNSTEYDCTFKILVLGDSGVGKTCLIYRYTEGLFSDTYVSTIGIDCRTKMLDLGNQKVRMQIWDTAGQERFRTLTSAYYRGAMGILLVFDVTVEETFNHVASWLRNIEDNASADVCKLLVGNKCDMDDMRKVSKHRGEMIAENNSLQYFETSAKSGDGVMEAFATLAKLIQQQRDHKKEIPDNLSNSILDASMKSQNEKGKCC